MKTRVILTALLLSGCAATQNESVVDSEDSASAALSFETQGCSDPRDTITNYDKTVAKVNDIAPGYYVMRYSWSPGFCRGVSSDQKRPGKKNFLQCSSGQNFGYVLHGLWPQGEKTFGSEYPRACEGDQPEISKEVLDKYLCMTPSYWLLQHEYEYHGTCMHDESLETPEAYFDTALMLHNKITLPSSELKNKDESYDWLVENNEGMKREHVLYSGGEWQICFDLDFEFTDCPTRSTVDENCEVKGNISKRTRNKYYFTSDHPGYGDVRIELDKGERCFNTPEEAVQAGWAEAPR